MKRYRDAVDVAINLHGSGPQSTRTLMSLRARRTIAFRHRNVPAVDGPAWDDDEHEVTRWCRLVASAGVLADRDELGLPVPDVTALVAPGGVIVHPGAAAPARRWPVERFARVARHVHERGASCGPDRFGRRSEIASRVATRAGIACGHARRRNHPCRVVRHSRAMRQRCCPTTLAWRISPPPMECRPWCCSDRPPHLAGVRLCTLPTGRSGRAARGIRTAALVDPALGPNRDRRRWSMPSMKS